MLDEVILTEFSLHLSQFLPIRVPSTVYSLVITVQLALNDATSQLETWHDPVSTCFYLRGMRCCPPDCVRQPRCVGEGRVGGEGSATVHPFPAFCVGHRLLFWIASLYTHVPPSRNILMPLCESTSQQQKPSISRSPKRSTERSHSSGLSRWELCQHHLLPFLLLPPQKMLNLNISTWCRRLWMEQCWIVFIFTALLKFCMSAY